MASLSRCIYELEQNVLPDRYVSRHHDPDSAGRMMRLSLTARTPGVTSAATRTALFSETEIDYAP